MKYKHMYGNNSRSLTAHAWFRSVRSRRIIRQLARNAPGRLAVIYASAHLKVALS